MDGNFKLWDEILKTIQTLTSWPLITLYLVLLFRQALAKQIPAMFKSFESLIERLAKVKYKGIEAEFELEKLRKFASTSRPELLNQVLLNVNLEDNADEDAASSEGAEHEEKDNSK